MDKAKLARLSTHWFPLLKAWETIKFMFLESSLQLNPLFLKLQGIKGDDLKVKTTKVKSVSDQRLVQLLKEAISMAFNYINCTLSWMYEPSLISTNSL